MWHAKPGTGHAQHNCTVFRRLKIRGQHIKPVYSDCHGYPKYVEDILGCITKPISSRTDGDANGNYCSRFQNSGHNGKSRFPRGYESDIWLCRRAYRAKYSQVHRFQLFTRYTRYFSAILRRFIKQPKYIGHHHPISQWCGPIGSNHHFAVGLRFRVTSDWRSSNVAHAARVSRDQSNGFKRKK